WDESSPSRVVGIRPPPPIKQKAPPVAKLDPVPEKSPLRQKDAFKYHDPRHTLPYSAHPLPPSQLDIDLEQIVSPENRKQGTNASESTKTSSVAGYGIIPDRHSSKNKVLGTRVGATNSAQRALAEKVPIRKRSYERLVPDGGHVLRPSFSADSLRGVHDHEKSIREFLDLSDDQSSASKVKINGKLVHKSTVNWLRDILSSNGPYEHQLTALPPRTRKGERTTSTTRGRSQTAPSAPVLDIYLGATLNPEEKQGARAEPRTDGKVVVPETFTRTIDDLEQLLNEAIHIARQAADTQNPAYMPALLGSAAKKLHDGRKEFSEEIAYNQALRRSQRSTTKYSDETSVGSMHESLRSYSGDGSSDFSDENEYRYRTPYANRSIAVPPNRLKRDSGWTHTQRSSEHYQQPLLAANNNEDIDYIRAADPRSKPAEINFTDISREASDERAQPEALGLLSASTPEFENEDPFSNLSGGTARRISERSPRRLSPTRKLGPTHNSQGVDLGAIPLPTLTPRGQSVSQNCIDRGHSDDSHEAVKAKLASKLVPGKSENDPENVQLRSGKTYAWQDIDHSRIEPCSQNTSRLMTASLHDQSTLPYSTTQGSSEASEVLDFDVGYINRAPAGGQPPRKPPPDRQEGEAQEPNTNRSSREREKIELRDVPNPDLPTTQPRRRGQRQQFSLRGKNHMSLKGEHQKGFSFTKSHKKPTIARDWKPFRKRFCATVACISTALVGILAGIYAGETPAIQYYIVDFHHYTVLGNVFFFLGLAIPTFFFWPLPLLHGRKPYILGSMSLAMPLLFPQALAVGSFRNPKVSYYRVGLIMSRALMGFCLGFANMNFKSTLTDLFGASLQSENPHQEVVDQNDVRRHGGGMGVWLGLWTWSQMGSIGVGFMAGAVIINNLPPAWGFYICIIIIAAVLVLNVITPEVRRSAFRRSVAEVRNGEEVSRRLARGEVKMHMVQTGPKWWGEEVHYGAVLTLSMLRQPGFLVVAVYVAWMYAQIVLLVILLGSLCSNRYKFKSPLVGLSVCAVPLGAMLAIPFQKASICSRSRSKGPTSDDDTYIKKKVNWSDHMLRRAIFVLLLPFAGLGYTLTSTGPPLPFILPILFAALMSFLTNLAMAECHGILMETFDTSDLQPGMTGRARGRSGDKTAAKRTNYSSFPRVASAFGITQGIGYMLAAVSTAVGGTVTRKLGQQAATAVVAGILLILSLLLVGVLVRFKDVQIIPDSKMDDMTQWQNARRTSAFRRAEGIEEDEPWRPVIIGNPTHHTRRMGVLEMGSLTRWSEIRRKNLLVDSQSLEAKHPNLAVLEDVKERIKEKEEEIVSNTRRSLSRLSSGRSRRSDNRTYEAGDLGGHVEMVQPFRSGKGSRQRRPTGRP
ncbi:major facilitator superfamily domain-containing protein, partial [Tricladium varicosporioides]